MQIQNILSLVTYLPAAAAVALLLFPRRSERAIKTFAFLVSVVTFVLSLHLYFHFDATNGHMQFEESVSWIEGGMIRHHLGIDGISLFLILLTTFLTPLAILSSWHAVSERVKPYMICMLLLETGMLGVFCALDLVLFYVFWEVMLIPMYFLIGVWGGERRIYAAVKFILYTMVGSLLMLVAILYLFHLNGGTTFDYLQIARNLASGAVRITIQRGVLAVHGVSARLCHQGAVVSVSYLAPGCTRRGSHGRIGHSGRRAAEDGHVRPAALLPARSSLPRRWLPLPICRLLALIGIVYGALVAMVQPDMKKLVAYSSVSHMGLVVLGIFAFTQQGLQGSTLQMLNHGLSTGALFLLVGMMYERRHTRLIADFGGVAHAIRCWRRCSWL